MITQILADKFIPEVTPFLRSTLIALAWSLVVAAAAQITVPVWSAPMKLQSLAVLAVGAACGFRLEFSALGRYAIEGAISLA